MATRVVTAVVAVLGLAFAGAVCVREVMLAHEQALAWAQPAWWTRLVQNGRWDRAGVAGCAALVAAAGLLTMALRIITPARPAPEAALEVGAADEGVAVAPSALHSLVRLTLRRELTGVEATRARVTRRTSDGRLAIRARVVAPPVGLTRLHADALSALRRELGHATGLETARLTLEIERFTTGK